MEVCYTTPDGRTTITAEIGKGKDVFEWLAKIREILDEKACCKCGSEIIRPVVRESGDFRFYEWQCFNQECRARLEFGQHKEGGTLFPKRWDKEKGGPIGVNGWYVWQPEGGGEGGGEGNGKPNYAPQHTKRDAVTSHPVMKGAKEVSSDSVPF